MPFSVAVLDEANYSKLTPHGRPSCASPPSQPAVSTLTVWVRFRWLSCPLMSYVS